MATQVEIRRNKKYGDGNRNESNVKNRKSTVIHCCYRGLCLKKHIILGPVRIEQLAI